MARGLNLPDAADRINFRALHQLVNVHAREEAEQVLDPAAVKILVVQGN